MLVLGNKNVSKLMLGQRTVSKAFLGKKLVWPNAQPLPYDARVLYVESDGLGSYINTGITPDTTSEIHIGFQVISVPFVGNQSSNYNSVWGACSTNSVWTARLVLSVRDGGSGQFYPLNPTLTTGTTNPKYDHNIHDVSFKSGEMVWDGVSLGLGNFNSTNIGNFCLGSRGTVELSTNPQYGYTQTRFYSCKIYTNNVLVFDGIPVRKNGVAYIYDRVSGRLCGNAGATGTSVTYGPDIPFDEYVQYIETDCVASYINTGITPVLATYSVSTKFQVLSVSHPTMTSLVGNNIFGAASSASPIGQRMSFVAQPVNSVFRTMIPNNASAPYPAYDNNVHVVSYGNSGLVFDGVSYPVNTSTNTCGPMCLGTRGIYPASAAPQNFYTQTRFYYFKIYDGENLVFDGIPVIDSNGVAGMYDRISKTLKYNAAATGTITPGPRI